MGAEIGGQTAVTAMTERITGKKSQGICKSGRRRYVRGVAIACLADLVQINRTLVSYGT